MWLPETAVDTETLDVLAQEGIAFTIVAPHQVREAPKGGLPGRYRTSGGRSIVLFPYHGPLSHGVAFGSLLDDAEEWARSLIAEGREKEGGRRLISLATDGETYGHHHPFGEMALAGLLEILARTKRMRVENFASFLSRMSDLEELELEEPTSWSCTHGVDRWRSDCGCRLEPNEETQQEWRGPLREAMDWLASRLHTLYEDEVGALTEDPWALRDRLGEETPADLGGIASMVREAASRKLTRSEEDRAVDLLEMERNTLRLFTSCGWFFDDLAGIEPVQVLRYAARALALAESAGKDVREGFLTILWKASSNENPPRDGRRIFLEEAEPSADKRAVTDSSSPENEDAHRPQSELGRKLIEEIRRLDRSRPLEELRTTARRVQELAELHNSRDIPIPFDAQTHFFRILQKAPPDQAEVLDSLRFPLGFVPSS
jgi:hypothetical protein